MKFILQYTNAWAEKFYFCNFGEQWPHHPERRMISRTSPAKTDAHVFDNEEDARAAIVTAGSPHGWEVVPA